MTVETIQIEDIEKITDDQLETLIDKAIDGHDIEDRDGYVFSKDELIEIGHTRFAKQESRDLDFYDRF